jgi:hypothetical protein
MELFEMRKVVDPHKHFPKDITTVFFEAFREYGRGNDSYITYSVGEYISSLKPGDEDDEYYNPDMAVFDKWMLEHFEKGEDLLILHWW